jgi:hypothetical protein
MVKFREEISNDNITTYVDTYFFHENEDLTNFFYTEIKDLNKLIIKDITKNQYNNKIGFFQFFLGDNKFIKIYIFPKTITINVFADKDELINVFNLYFKEYLRLKRKYINYAGYKDVKDNIIDFDLNVKNDIEDYIILKYQKILLETINFFKKHNKDYISTLKFFSQDISSPLDIRKNVIEINKSKIHQSQDLILNYSLIAETTLAVLNSFSNFKLPFLNNSVISNEVKILSSLLKKIINNRYSIQNNIKSRSKVFKNLNSKLFNKDYKLLNLKNNLFFLLGWENNNNSNKIHDVDSIWFSTEYMYELCVLEFLELYAIKNNVAVICKPEKKYNFIIDNKVQGSINSIPDFILETENSIYIIDAKWKIIYDINSISFIDILKADRDSIIHKYHNKEVKLLLFYPLIFMNKDVYLGKNISFDYLHSPIFQIYELDLLNNDNQENFNLS